MLKKEKKRAADAMLKLQSGGSSLETRAASEQGTLQNGHYRSETETRNKSANSRESESSHKGVAERLKQQARSSSRQQVLEKEREGMRSENEERLKRKICKLPA